MTSITPLNTTEISQDMKSLPAIEKTTFSLDTLPYINTTETISQDTITEISTIAQNTMKKIYMGFSFHLNYHILAKRDVHIALICDINKGMHKLYEFIQETITQDSITREQFLEKLQNTIIQHPADFHTTRTPLKSRVMPTFQKLQTDKFSWLYSDRSFNKIRQMYLEGRIKHLNVNLKTDTEYFQSLGTWAKKCGYIFDAIYISNIPEWIQKEGAIAEMKNNLLHLLSPQTLLIDAKQQKWESGEPLVRVTQNIQSKKDFPSFDPAQRESKTKRYRSTAPSSSSNCHSPFSPAARKRQRTTHSPSSFPFSLSPFPTSLPICTSPVSPSVFPTITTTTTSFSSTSSSTDRKRKKSQRCLFSLTNKSSGRSPEKL